MAKVIKFETAYAHEMVELQDAERKLNDLQRVLIANHTKEIANIERQLKSIGTRRQFLKDQWNARAMSAAEWHAVTQKDTPHNVNRRIRNARNKLNLAREKWGMK